MHSSRLLPLAVLTYVNSFFSKMKHIKSKARTRLTDEYLEEILRIVTALIESDLEAIMKQNDVKFHINTKVSTIFHQLCKVFFFFFSVLNVLCNIVLYDHLLYLFFFSTITRKLQSILIRLTFNFFGANISVYKYIYANLQHYLFFSLSSIVVQLQFY